MSAAGTGTARAAAFYDVDETLIGVKSMFDFLDFYLAHPETGPSHARDLRLTLLRAAAQDRDVPREEVNRTYYRVYTGESARRLAQLGDDWFAQRRRRPGFVLAPVLATLVRHRLAGHPVVLVSGSMPACLDPLARAVGAAHVLCSRPLVDADDRLTGEIEASLIGAGKRRAVRALAAEQDLSLPLSFGYADHTSDLPMLTLLGHPAVVGEEPGLLAHADANGWLRFPKVVAP